MAPYGYRDFAHLHPRLSGTFHTMIIKGEFIHGSGRSEQTLNSRDVSPHLSPLHTTGALHHGRSPHLLCLGVFGKESKTVELTEDAILSLTMFLSEIDILAQTSSGEGYQVA